MQYNFSFDISAIVLYLFVIFFYFNRPHIKDKMHLIYINLFTCALLSPIFDILSAYVINNGQNIFLILIFTLAYFLTLQGIAYFFLMFIVYHIRQYRDISKFRQFLIMLPNLLTILLISSNEMTGLIFTYSVNTGYSKGPLNWVCYAVAISYAFWAIIYVTTNKEVFNKQFQYCIYNICVINILIMVLQMFLPNVLLMCFGFSVSFLLLFMNGSTKNNSINSVTKMLNREFFIDTTNKMIHSKAEFSIIFARIADYTLLTELYGDKLIQRFTDEVAKKIMKYCKIGQGFKTNSDSFAIIVQDSFEANELINTMNEEIVKSIDFENIAFSMYFTLCNYPADAKNETELTSYRHAFERNHHENYGIINIKDLKIKNLTRQLEIEKAIRRGMDNGNLQIYYQPIYSIKDKKFVAAEALIRLFDDELGYISPAEFIPVAEQSGLMIPLGNFVLENVCRFISEHDMEKLGLEYIEVNLSVIQCLQKSFLSTFNSIVKKYNIQKDYLCFEITETASENNSQALTKNLKSLVENKYHLALDDFGTGSSNYQRLVDVHYTIIKFDKNMTQLGTSSNLLMNAFRNQISVFHSVNFKIVAEGVETQEELDFLTASQTDYIQGWIFSKALPEDDFVEFIKLKNKI